MTGKPDLRLARFMIKNLKKSLTKNFWYDIMKKI